MSTLIRAERGPLTAQQREGRRPGNTFDYLRFYFLVRTGYVDIFQGGRDLCLLDYLWLGGKGLT